MLTDEKERKIMQLWDDRWNTAEIARLMGLREGEVARIVPAILEHRRTTRLANGRRVLRVVERRTGVRPVSAARLRAVEPPSAA